MSYYANTIHTSLSYGISLKSVGLSRKHKYHILGSFTMFLLMLILLVRIELTILYKLFLIIASIFQIFFTIRYSCRLVRVLNWKILDTKIAFGTENFQYKSYTNSLDHFKRFLTWYSVTIYSFCIYIILQFLSNIATLSHPFELKRVLGYCLTVPPSFIHRYIQILIVFLYITSYCIMFTMVISIFCLFSLNLATIPYLFSKINVSCHFKQKLHKMSSITNFSQVREPLLK